MTFQIREIPIDRIRVIDPFRKLDKQSLAAIKGSMAKIGLKTPITVRAKKKGPVLVTGLHRLKAAKSLGWKEILCFIVDDSKIDAKLWGLSENLHRAELTAIQRSDFIQQWERLFKQRTKAAQVAQPGGRQPHDRGTSRTAKALGTNRDEIRRARAIASISPRAKAAAEAAGLANNKAALLAVSKEDGARAQVKKVHALAKRKIRFKDGLLRGQKRQLGRLIELFEATRELKRAWTEAAAEVRKAFVSQLLKQRVARPKRV
jgi:ParB-like chromosome segregation protein Spo0J